MAIGDNSYGSVAEVTALTRRLLRSESAFNSTTTPTVTEVEKMIDRVSGQLNSALASEGFTVPVSQSDVKLALDDWTIARVVQWVELSVPGHGWGSGENTRTAGFSNLYAKARDFVKENRVGWERLGASVSHEMSEGLTFTGLDKHSERTDPDSTTLEQPKFRRGQFDN